MRRVQRVWIGLLNDKKIDGVSRLTLHLFFIRTSIFFARRTPRNIATSEEAPEAADNDNGHDDGDDGNGDILPIHTT